MSIIIYSEEPDFKPIIIGRGINDGDDELILIHISEAPRKIYDHANEFIHGRWPEAEHIIMKDPQYACWYAKDVIEGRWPEAEPTIMKDKTLWDEYCKHFAISD